MNELYLSHHGILGQKWGVRRYQNEDGSLTNLGKKRKKVINDLDIKAKAINKDIPENPWITAYNKELKKNPNADFDDFWDGYSEKRVNKIEKDYSEWNKKYEKASNDAYHLMYDKHILEKGIDKVKSDTKTAAIVSSILAAPVAGLITAGATKNISSGKARVAIILASMGGTVITTTWKTAANGMSTLKKTEEKYGLR